jgi:hypothetical protein
MIVHLVLFRPKRDLPDADRRGLVEAIARAHREIASIRSFTVGKRTMRDVSYAQAMPDYPYVAVVEFETERGLQEYLAHPAHQELGRRFWETSDSPLAYDYELLELTAAIALLGEKNSSIS